MFYKNECFIKIIFVNYVFCLIKILTPENILLKNKTEKHWKSFLFILYKTYIIYKYNSNSLAYLFIKLKFWNKINYPINMSDSHLLKTLKYILKKKVIIQHKKRI